MNCNKHNTCILVITYNPNKDFSKNARQYLNIVNNVVIVDNGSKENIKTLIDTDIIHNFHIIHSQENKGIAWALNRGIEWCVNKKFLYVLTFDQDSYPSIDILLYYNKILEANTNVGLIGTSYTTNSFGNLSVSVEEKLSVITSGLLHPIETIKNVGLYKENLFIDSVDFDYALRVKRKGYRILRTKTPFIIHHLGDPIKRFGIVSSNHSIVRRYYMARNNVYLTKKYGFYFPLFIIKKNFYFFKYMFAMIIVENNKYKKLKVTIKGLIDGFSFK